MKQRRIQVLGAVAALCAAFAVLVQLQPIGDPWWTNPDPNVAYVSAGVSLFGGRESRYFDHPGTPIEELVAAALTVDWAIDPHGQSRSERADALFRDFDSTRPLFRTLAIGISLLSVLVAFAVLLVLTGSAVLGLLAGVLFLASPDLLIYSITLKPDIPLSALCLAVVGITVMGYRRRSAGIYLAAASLLGFALTIKLHAIALVVPWALAVALHPPVSGWATGTVAAVRGFLRRHRRGATVAAATWLALVILLNLGNATPDGRRTAELVAGLAAVSIAAAGVWLIGRRTRAAGIITIGAAAALCGIAGALVPNLFFASTVPVMPRWVVLSLLGRGVNADAVPLSSSALSALRPWLLIFILAALGAVRGLRRREGETLIWAVGALCLGGLAAARFGTPHYFQPAVALSIPLLLSLVGRPTRWTLPVAAAVVAALVFVPLRNGTKAGQDNALTRSASLQQWTRAHLGPHEGAITPLATEEQAYAGFVLNYGTSPPPMDNRILPADTSGLEYLKAHGLKLRYLIDPRGSADLKALGLVNRFRPIEGLPGVFEYR